MKDPDQEQKKVKIKNRYLVYMFFMKDENLFLMLWEAEDFQ